MIAFLRAYYCIVVIDFCRNIVVLIRFIFCQSKFRELLARSDALRVTCHMSDNGVENSRVPSRWTLGTILRVLAEGRR